MKEPPDPMTAGEPAAVAAPAAAAVHALRPAI
jgi:hypothetical protein